MPNVLGIGAGAAREAAVLAGLGIGLYADPGVGTHRAEQPVERPGRERRAAMEHAFRVYSELYPRLAPAFAAS